MPAASTSGTRSRPIMPEPGRCPCAEEEKADAAGFFYTAMSSFWDGSLIETATPLLKGFTITW